MLAAKEVAATIPVKDLQKARKFYQETLGLTPIETEDGEAVTFEAGRSRVLVYRSEFAGTNKATAATWGVGNDIEREVQTLKDKGVSFEHYKDMPNTTLKGDVHVSGDMKAAWFKDPDGNIIAMVSR
jgi:catechol 2,3-dioxygenase-like lactoylglutathione lyase family enzyme